MTTYSAPLTDMEFVLRNFCALDDIMAMPKFADIDASSVTDVLSEAARFFEEQFAPLNKVGDVVGSHRNGDGTVTTPDGFKEAYRAYVDAGWGALGFDPGFGGGGFPWVVNIALQEIMNSANMALAMAPLLTTRSCTTATRSRR